MPEFEERYIQVRFKLKLTPYRIDHEVDSISVDLWYGNGGNLEDGARIVAFDLDIPVTLFDPPLIKGKIKSQITEMFESFIEGMELENAN